MEHAEMIMNSERKKRSTSSLMKAVALRSDAKPDVAELTFKDR